MKFYIIRFALALLILIISPYQSFASKAFNVYMNDFYSKSDKASLILKEIEIDLKNGSRRKVCSRQKEAARLGLLANKSLIKAFEIEGIEPPIQVIKASQAKWKSILHEC